MEQHTLLIQAYVTDITKINLFDLKWNGESF